MALVTKTLRNRIPPTRLTSKPTNYPANQPATTMLTNQLPANQPTNYLLNNQTMQRTTRTLNPTTLSACVP